MVLNLLSSKIFGAGSEARARRALDGAIKDGLPDFLQAASEFLVTGAADEGATRVREAVENRRKGIANDPSGPVEIYYSPKPGSADDAVNRPTPGSVLKFSRQRVAATGKDPRWGTFLHYLSRESGARNILELGACAGLSALYLGSTPSLQSLTTIEAAVALADIARETVNPLGGKAIVITALFDDALDDILATHATFDFVYIDGHHEKVATIHYFDRVLSHLQKGAIVLFDDTNWSDDMRAGWEELRCRRGFSHAADFGVVGVCVWEGGDVTAKQWDMRGLTNSYDTGKPHGWSYEEGQYVA